jgi:hypothetical protein
MKEAIKSQINSASVLGYQLLPKYIVSEIPKARANTNNPMAIFSILLNLIVTILLF